MKKKTCPHCPGGHGQEACLSDCDVKDREGGGGGDRSAKSGMLTGPQVDTKVLLTGWTPQQTIA